VTFLQMYGEQLDKELGSSDTSLLFTTAKRKSEVNRGQAWFVEQTECLVRETTIAIVDGTQEYDVEATITDFLRVSKQNVELKITPSSGDPEYYAGKEFPRRDIAWLNANMPGWRNLDDGRPICWYLQEDGGTVNIGIVPAPDVQSGETWVLTVPYVARPADMSADADEPFTVSSNVKKSLSPWHDALVYYAASELEKLRKNVPRSLELLQYAQSRVQDYKARMQPKGGSHISFARDYRREASTASRDAHKPWLDDPRK
jgi:hypothetical protein